MKQALLLISRYFSGFLAGLFIFALFLLYLMMMVPADRWVGSMSGRNFTANAGGRLINFFDNDYFTFFLLPFFPFLIGFFMLSVFIWVNYRHDGQAGRTGFRNIILAVLAAFLLIFLPIQAARLGYKIQERQEERISQIYGDGTVYVNKGFDKEFLKLYQTLADEGIQSWRKDPLAVVKNELETGDLTSLNRGENKLTLKIIDSYEPSGNPRAVVALENDKLKAEIFLSRYWESPDGVWLVKSYKMAEK
ncbi:MAG: hypothetical protein Q8O93_03805 [bacterium]|nr:hypothetical protein [bacterium]